MYTYIYIYTHIYTHTYIYEHNTITLEDITYLHPAIGKLFFCFSYTILLFFGILTF